MTYNVFSGTLNPTHSHTMQLAENTGCKKNRHLAHRTTLSGCIFPTKAGIDNQKKLFKQQYRLYMS